VTVETWLEGAIADADRRGLPELKPLLETLAKAVTAIRAADFNVNASTDRRAPGREPR